jgi:uncharacterized membrane protein
MKSIKSSYWLTLLSLLGLVICIVVWNAWLATDQEVPLTYEIAVFCIPLLFFLKGVFSGKRGTYVSLMVVAFFYFLAGIWHIIEPSERLYGAAITALSFCLYLGGYFYAKNHDKIAQAKFDAEEARALKES